ncbi:MAG: EscU/YscU/HrcU family type III secretion system export apparatus switch protein [Deltaproteobacteria bacterium]|jgi:flagellar biosynthesis protein|nr:EscU/YscU/HrcU family type III secretion system export apparatus switch protein [Deltaproteobacteria bacterium]MCL5879688.1 EscU/YscU/HrcU family type III secretion system export apparatus switch protein [Deltaproteobacteria bacterium]MDA8304053.1 EscU/YscU/HrcU family type III secretion system export apparatus switch protein [Deltaproteobacteria bacterium]
MKEYKNYKNIKASALRYDKEKEDAPILIAKGQGKIAEKIIEIANKENIPVVKNKALADILDKLDIYDEIPPELYKVVARLFAFIYKLNEKASEDLKFKHPS